MEKVRLDSDGVKQLILSVDDDKLNEQLLAQLLKYLPSKEEMQQLGTYKDKLHELSDAEQFGAVVCLYALLCYCVLDVFMLSLSPQTPPTCLQMSDVKRLPERLECMLFRVRFDEELSELQPVSHFTTVPPSFS